MSAVGPTGGFHIPKVLTAIGPDIGLVAAVILFNFVAGRYRRWNQLRSSWLNICAMSIYFLGVSFVQFLPDPAQHVANIFVFLVVLALSIHAIKKGTLELRAALVFFFGLALSNITSLIPSGAAVIIGASGIVVTLLGVGMIIRGPAPIEGHQLSESGTI